MKYPRPFLFDCFNPDCGAALITAVAEAMSEGLDADQMNVLGTFLTAVADTISYMAAQRQHNEDTCPKYCPDKTGGDNKGVKNNAQYPKRTDNASSLYGDASDR